MDQNGDYRDKAVDLESIIGPMPTFSKLTRRNLKKFDRAVRDLLSFQDTYLFEGDEQTGYRLLFEGPFRFQSLDRTSSRLIEYQLIMRIKKGLEGSYPVCIKLTDKPEYAFVHKEADGKKSGALYLSINMQSNRKTFVYHVREFDDRDKNKNNHHSALALPYNSCIGISN